MCEITIDITTTITIIFCERPRPPPYRRPEADEA